MPVTLTIKHVPDEVAEALRKRAARHHRSLQGELMAIVEAVAGSGESASAAPLAGGLAADSERGLPSPSAPTPSDSLLDELDAIVAGSHWGEAPLLTRAQSHDRALTREIDYQVQEEPSRYQK